MNKIAVFPLKPFILENKHVTMIKKLVSFLTEKRGKSHFPIYFKKVTTHTVENTRMGKGKGAIGDIVAPIYIGQCFLEVVSFPEKDVALLIKVLRCQLGVPLLYKKQVIQNVKYNV